MAARYSARWSCRVWARARARAVWLASAAFTRSYLHQDAWARQGAFPRARYVVVAVIGTVCSPPTASPLLSLSLTAYRRPRSGGCVTAGRRRLSPVPTSAVSPFRARWVAGRRGDRGTIKELGPDSFPPPNIPDVEFSPVRLKADVPGGQPAPSRSSPACARVSQRFAMAFGSDRLPAPSRRGHSSANAEHSRRRSPSHSPRRPEALCSGALLSAPSSLLRPHAPVSRPPTNFPGSPVSGSRVARLPG